jgi:hypothetical protein
MRVPGLTSRCPLGSNPEALKKQPGQRVQPPAMPETLVELLEVTGTHAVQKFPFSLQLPLLNS